MWVAQVRPQQRGNHDGNDDEDAAHGWCAGLLLVRLGTLFTNVLPDLKLAQFVDEPWAQNNAEEERGQAGKRRAKGRVAEHAERADVSLQLFVEQPVEHD